MEMVLLITVREAVSLLHRTPARFTSSLRSVCNEKAETGTVCGFCFGFFQLINIKFMLYLYRNMSMIKVT